jgi:molybdopterin converting factor small subunit
VRVAVNEEFVETSTRLRGGEVVALIPPVSGG